MNEVPQARVYSQPLTVCPKVPLISWSFADGLIGARATLRSLEGTPGDIACISYLIMVSTGQAPWRSSIGMGVDLLALRCTSKQTVSRLSALVMSTAYPACPLTSYEQE